jgi:hypothetical protein
MSSISHDIGAIRQVIENWRIEPPKTQEPSAFAANSEATIIPLDFEAFLERRKTG